MAKIKIKDNKTLIEITEKESTKLMQEGILFEYSKGKFKFLDKEENIFIESKGGLKE